MFSFFVHLAVANNRDNSIEHVSDADARPVWILRGAKRDDIDRAAGRRVRRSALNSVERVALCRKVEINGRVETLTTFDHPLPDAGQARNATAVFAIPEGAQMLVWVDGEYTPFTPQTALSRFGRWIEDDIAIANGQKPGRAFSAQ